MSIQEIKQRFSIIGSSTLMDHAIRVAMQVAPTEISVLVNGESGVGKEVFPKIIHFLSPRKHGPYIAVNCGAIPEGTIDSELFGHEKGSFTGAHEARKGYFEVVSGGTIFLDEVAELPLSTQVRLLRVLEAGEFLKVGSSKIQKTDVRVVAATNVNMTDAVKLSKFREDLYYRLNTVPIHVPPLRERKEDIFLLFRKFVSDFADKYRMPSIQLTAEAQQILAEYRWPGNVRQLKNLSEQLSILEENRIISPSVLRQYLPSDTGSNLPVLARLNDGNSEMSERDLLYKVLFELKRDVIDLKKLVLDLIRNAGNANGFQEHNAQMLEKLYNDVSIGSSVIPGQNRGPEMNIGIEESLPIQEHEVVEESLSLEEREIELIKKALKKYKGRRKQAAKDLGISERTLYRKINEYNIR